MTDYIHIEDVTITIKKNHYDRYDVIIEDGVSTTRTVFENIHSYTRALEVTEEYLRYRALIFQKIIEHIKHIMKEKPFHPACDVFFSLRTPSEKVYGFIEYLRKKGFQSFLLPDGKTVRTEASIETIKKVDKTFGVQSIAILKGVKECRGLRYEKR